VIEVAALAFVVGFALAMVERVRRPVERLGWYALAPLVLFLAAAWAAVRRRPAPPRPAPPRSRPVEVAAAAVEAEAEAARVEAAEAAEAPRTLDAEGVAAGLARHARGRP
jgi:hypothetical protein